MKTYREVCLTKGGFEVENTSRDKVTYALLYSCVVYSCNVYICAPLASVGPHPLQGKARNSQSVEKRESGQCTCRIARQCTGDGA